MDDSQICVDCRRVAPETETDYTLISGKHGWRLQRRRTEDDDGWTIDWRCPDCWRAFKKTHEGDVEPPRSLAPTAVPSSPSMLPSRPASASIASPAMPAGPVAPRGSSTRRG